MPTSCSIRFSARPTRSPPTNSTSHVTIATFVGGSRITTAVARSSPSCPTAFPGPIPPAISIESSASIGTAAAPTCSPWAATGTGAARTSSSGSRTFIEGPKRPSFGSLCRLGATVVAVLHVAPEVDDEHVGQDRPEHLSECLVVGVREVFVAGPFRVEREDEAVGEALGVLLRAHVRAPRQHGDRGDFFLQPDEGVLDGLHLLLRRAFLELQADDVEQHLPFLLFGRAYGRGEDHEKDGSSHEHGGHQLEHGTGLSFKDVGETYLSRR